MKTVLITGANRGLGLGMVKYLTKQNSVKTIIATCRTVSEEMPRCCVLNCKETGGHQFPRDEKLKKMWFKALRRVKFEAKSGARVCHKYFKESDYERLVNTQELKTLLAENKNLVILDLDVKNTSSFGDLSTKISNVVGNQGLNLLINNAGVTTKFTKLPLVKAEQLLDNLTVNTIAPILLTKALLPILKQASDANSDKPMGGHRAAVINMSSILGSISQNDQGGFYPYRCSKAALNAASKSMSVDLKKDNILVASMHPGWVKTDMGGQNAPLDVETSVSGIFKTIDKLSENDTGKFLNYDGSELPW